MTAAARYTARPYLRSAAMTLAVLVLGFGSWGALARIEGAVIAPGKVAAARLLYSVQHPEGGRIAALHVEEGAQVAPGALLLRLDDTRLRAELRLVEAQMIELLVRRAGLLARRDGSVRATSPDLAALGLSALQGRVTARIEAESALLAAQQATRAGLRAQLDQRRAQIDMQIAGIAAQIAAVDRQIALTTAERETQAELLGRGLAQADRLQALEREDARLEGRRGALVAERALAAERQAEIAQQILSLQAAEREEVLEALRDVTRQQAELTERLLGLRDQISGLELRAPTAGRVHGLSVAGKGAVLRPAEPALHLVPAAPPASLSARLSPQEIGQVAPGQQAEVRFPGLQQRQLPRVGAVVTHVSADAFTDTAAGMSYYAVELRLVDTDAALPALKPGMPVELFFQTGAHSPLAYLIQPLREFFSHALREG